MNKQIKTKQCKEIKKTIKHFKDMYSGDKEKSVMTSFRFPDIFTKKRGMFTGMEAWQGL